MRYTTSPSFRFIKCKTQVTPHSTREISRVSNFSRRGFFFSLSLFLPFSLSLFHARYRVYIDIPTNENSSATSRYPAIIPRTVIQQIHSPSCPSHTSLVRGAAALSIFRAIFEPRADRWPTNHSHCRSTMPPYLIFPVPVLAPRILGRGLCVMYILPIRYIHTPRGHTPRIISHNIRAWRA